MSETDHTELVKRAISEKLNNPQINRREDRANGFIDAICAGTGIGIPRDAFAQIAPALSEALRDYIGGVGEEKLLLTTSTSRAPLVAQVYKFAGAKMPEDLKAAIDQAPSPASGGKTRG